MKLPLLNLMIQFRLGNLEESRDKFSEALSRCKRENDQDPSYYSSISVTITYNLARVNEALCHFDLSEVLYKDILKEHPNYIDCMYKFFFYVIYFTFNKLFIYKRKAY